MERGSYMLLQPGMTVRGADGRSLGTVAEVVADTGVDIFRGIVLQSGGFRRENVFVPGDQVAAVEGNTVTLALREDDLANLEAVKPAEPGQERGADFTPTSPDA